MQSKIDKIDISNSDAELVEAAQRGERERYGELVARYERRAYAVAWSRLGDVHLAEEATQEAFIRGYRRLSLLSDGAKFASWMLAIVRNTAVNLGIRHRRELEKRKRWAIEPVAGPTQGDDTEPEICSVETLRQTLSELPEKHRECLVLFYLEGKSGAETALALGLSEEAFRVRLHRARAALRERLEGKLAESLDQLRPSRPLAPLIMAGILVSSSAKATAEGAAIGLGTKVVSSLGKVFSLGWIVPLIPLLSVLPGLLFARLFVEVERRNFRDPGGFRVHLHKYFFRSFMWGFPLLVVVIFLVTSLSHFAWGEVGSDSAVIGSNVVLLGFLFLCFLLPVRMLVINRSRFAVGAVLYCGIMCVGLTVNTLGRVPPQAHMLPFIIATVVYAFFVKDRPARIDYNLFLRSAQKLLRDTNHADDGKSNSFSRKSLLEFARFMGTRWLVVGYRWRRNGLALRLPPVKGSWVGGMARTFMPMTASSSHILLGFDGTVLAYCSERDLADVQRMSNEQTPTKSELENHVCNAVKDAWQRFDSGDFSKAERSLGETTDVFVVPSSRAMSTRLVSGCLIATAVLLTVLTLENWEKRRLSFVTGKNLKAVKLTEAEVRAGMAVFVEPSGKQQGRERASLHALCLRGAAADEPVHAGGMGDGEETFSYREPFFARGKIAS
jgi:RNA polymerase sigma-70 factor (ECF subfamily)